MKFVLAGVGAILFSLGSVAYAAYFGGAPGDAGRCGAVVVAVSFGFLFLGNRTSTEVYSLLKEEAALLAGESKNSADLNALVGRLDTQAKEERERTLYLAITSVVGTLFWGFGDVVASWLPH